MGLLFMLRWAARDLRRRWPQVVAIALVISIGTGIYAALGSTATWRRESNDASFGLLHMYDLRIRSLRERTRQRARCCPCSGTCPMPASWPRRRSG
jgi:hypothetical protein